MNRFAAESRVKVLYTTLMKRRVTLLSFIALILFSTQFLYNSSTSGLRPKTEIIFVNKNVCTWSAAEGNYEKTAVVMVLSARNNFDRRMLIRKTYATMQKAFNVQILGVVFMLGNWDARGSDVTDPDKLQEEKILFGDIVVGDFVDSYRNLTLKTIMAYEWVTSYCRDAQIVVKTDDDVFLNIYQLTREISSWSNTEMAASNIRCMVDRNENTIKDRSSLYYASPLDFPDGVFPNHCEGLGYVTSIGVIDRILNEIRESYPGRVCTHEDVFMTGLVRLHINSNSNYFWRNPEPIELVNKKYSWRSLDLQDGRGDEDYFLRTFIKETTMDLRKLYNFRRWYRQKIFYLITYSDDFTEKFTRLWKIVTAVHELDML